MHCWEEGRPPDATPTPAPVRKLALPSSSQSPKNQRGTFLVGGPRPGRSDQPSRRPGTSILGRRQAQMLPREGNVLSLTCRKQSLTINDYANDLWLDPLRSQGDSCHQTRRFVAARGFSTSVGALTPSALARSWQVPPRWTLRTRGCAGRHGDLGRPGCRAREEGYWKPGGQ